MPSRAIGSATRTLTRPARRPAGAATPSGSRAAPLRGRRRPRRARPARPCSSETTSSVLDRAEDLLERHRAEVAEPEDLAGQLALAAGQDEAAALDLAVERLPVEAVGDLRGGDRPRRVAAGRRRARSRAPRGPARAAAAHASWRAKIAVGALRRSSAAGPRRPGRRPRSPASTASRRRPCASRCGAQVEVEARHRRRLHRRPGARRGRDHRQARARPSRPSASRSRRRRRPRRPSRTARRRAPTRCRRGSARRAPPRGSPRRAPGSGSSPRSRSRCGSAARP